MATCAAEGCRAAGTQKCGRCGMGYCSTDCQRRHWPMHKATCQPCQSFCCPRAIQALEEERLRATQPEPPELQRELRRLADPSADVADVSISGLSQQGSCQLLGALRGQRLQLLVLEDCHLDAQAARLLAELPKDSLQALNLAHNQLEVTGLQLLFPGDLRSLRELNLRDNLLGPKAAEIVAQLVLAGPELKVVNLAENFLQEEGAALLAKALQDAGPRALHLDLRGNELRLSGAKSLASVLGSFEALELASNRLGDFGAKALAQKLADNSSLTSIGLAENRIGDEGAKALAESLGASRALKSLELDYNSITDGSCLAQLTCEVTLAGAEWTLGISRAVSTGIVAMLAMPVARRMMMKSVKFPSAGGGEDADTIAFFDNVFAGRWMSSVGERGEEDMDELEPPAPGQMEEEAVTTVCGDIAKYEDLWTVLLETQLAQELRHLYLQRQLTYDLFLLVFITSAAILIQV
ncbi:unnamed protein product [Effrenium voratum]|nr:unnamed protein product [Effrenium voratum]